jgi:hypothetical protein
LDISGTKLGSFAAVANWAPSKMTILEVQHVQTQLLEGTGWLNSYKPITNAA